MTTLADEEVVEIRGSRGRPADEVAWEYGITVPQVYAIRARRLHGWVGQTSPARKPSGSST